MKIIVIGALALLAGCAPDENSLEAQMARAEVVYMCANGTVIGRDAETRQLVYRQDGFLYSRQGRVPRGMSPMEFCR